MERVKGIEPSQPAWKAGALPLSYTRTDLTFIFYQYRMSMSRFFYKNIGGGERIRTTESTANGFTVRPL